MRVIGDCCPPPFGRLAGMMDNNGSVPTSDSRNTHPAYRPMMKNRPLTSPLSPLNTAPRGTRGWIDRGRYTRTLSASTLFKEAESTTADWYLPKIR